VLVLGGSEGGIGGAEVAALLAGRGFAALALAYFALDTLPAELVRIPLEYFTTALEILASEPHVDAKRLGIVGTSKGAEAALLVAARETRLRAVVAFAPSAVSWSCICAEGDAPSWTAENRPVPYVPPGADPTYRPPPGMPIRPVIHFRHRVRDSQAVSRAAIPVDQITAELLLISGAADALWPSQWSGDQIVRRLRRRGHRPPFAHLVFPGAGHLIPKGYLPAGSTRVGGGRLETGGTPAANARAQPEAWAATLRVLHRALARR
jgi:dienelactone hydrolase